MSDFISREAAIKLFNFAVLDCLGMEPTIRAGDIIKALESIPAADVRPVVLCRDCDCWNVWDRVRDTCSCGFWSEDRLIYTKEKDFCSWGRKRGVDE